MKEMKEMKIMKVIKKQKESGRDDVLESKEGGESNEGGGELRGERIRGKKKENQSQ